MRRSDFPIYIEEEFKKLIGLFSTKNQSYGKEDDLFYNFRHTATRLFGDALPDSMYMVLFAYVDKHMVALANRGLDDPEYDSRWDDVIVYALIAKAMGRYIVGQP
jgi:hypothetical protein